jgi:hypothetical protein
MHTDETKKFDKRNVEGNIRSGIITKKDYESYLSKLPDVREKLFLPEESPQDTEGKLRKDNEKTPRKKKTKKRAKGK